MNIGQRVVCLAYLVISLPTTIMAWYFGFPRGFYFAFIGLAIGFLILHLLKDDLVENRRVWKEYFIGLLGLVFMILYALYLGVGVYATLTDLYYLLIGITVFEIGILPFYYLMERDHDESGWLTIVGIALSCFVILVISYILFVVLDIWVVH